MLPARRALHKRWWFPAWDLPASSSACPALGSYPRWVYPGSLYCLGFFVETASKFAAHALSLNAQCVRPRLPGTFRIQQQKEHSSCRSFAPEMQGWSMDTIKPSIIPRDLRLKHKKSLPLWSVSPYLYVLLWHCFTMQILWKGCFHQQGLQRKDRSLTLLEMFHQVHQVQLLQQILQLFHRLVMCWKRYT